MPEQATEHLLASAVASFVAEHPKVTAEVVAKSRNVALVREGYDAGVRMEGIPKDMARVRLSGAFRLVVVGAPSYLARHGEPKKPDDLVRHYCVGMRGASGA